MTTSRASGSPTSPEGRPGPPDLCRVVVVGTAGAGKTTFARRLAQVTGGSHLELDALYWMPDWEPRPLDELRRLVSERAAQERWVADGNYRQLQPIVWSRATAVVWLNYSFARTFARALVRTVRRSLTGEVLFAGNRESLRSAFLSSQSILLWVLKTFHRNRVRYRKAFQDPAWTHLARVELRTPAEAERFLGAARAGASARAGLRQPAGGIAGDTGFKRSARKWL